MQQPTKTPETAKPTSAAAPAERSERAAQTTAVAKVEPKAEVPAVAQRQSIEALLVSPAFRKQIQDALPAHMKAERMARVMLTLCREEPKLLKCTPESFMSAMLTASALGLEPASGLDLCHMIPRRNGRLSDQAGHDVFECDFMTGYRGELQLIRNTGEVADVWAEVVWDCDEFDYRMGSHPVVNHKPLKTGKPPGAVVTHAYAIAVLTTGLQRQVVLDRADIDYHRSYAAKGSEAWLKSYPAMAKKTALREIAKTLPRSAEVAKRAAAADGGAVLVKPLPIPELPTGPTYVPDGDALEHKRREMQAEGGA